MVKGTSALLALAMLSGCATQKVWFTSVPVGATVIAGKKTGNTPCTLKVSEKLAFATFRLPSGEELVVPMTELDSKLEEVAEVGGEVLGGTLMFAGYVVGGAGAVVFLLAAASLDHGSEWDRGTVADDDESDAYAAMGIGLVAAVGGFGVAELGKWIYPDDAVPELHAEFDFSASGCITNAVDEDPRYEDVGYGARRLRKVQQ